MKKFHRRRAHGRRILLCLLALALLFVVLALRQNILRTPPAAMPF